MINNVSTDAVCLIDALHLCYNIEQVHALSWQQRWLPSYNMPHGTRSRLSSVLTLWMTWRWLYVQVVRRGRSSQSMHHH